MSNVDKLNRFVKNPVNITMSRSRFKRPFTHKTTFKSGDLVPIFLDEVLPGDTFKLDFSTVCRMLSPAVPVMDNSYLDIYFFWIPNRLCTLHPDDWQKICGENVSGYWAPSSEATLDNTGNMTPPYGQWNSLSVVVNSVAAYLGFPIGTWDANNTSTAYMSEFKFNIMPFIAYMKIWNEFFRDQNTQAPETITNSSQVITKFFGANSCLKVNRLHDYFTSSLPAPQKGNSVLLPIAGTAPVITSSSDIISGAQQPLHFRKASDGSIVYGDSLGVTVAGNTEVAGSAPSTGETVYPSNLYADLANASAVSVNEMRQAFAIQRMLEKDARGGTRYRELLKAHFGVTIPDLTVQVPEYLFGKRIPLNITQVLQTSETNTTPLGTTGAFSNTSYAGKMFTKSFNEYGYVMGVACVRTESSYSQGISKLWTRNRRFDWYYPVFANLGEQPVYSRELVLLNRTTATADEYKQVFGYQEAWAEYRYHPNQVSGALAPNTGNANFTAWTYTNYFARNAYPVLNSTFMKQPSDLIGRTLVNTTTNDQFVADFYFDLTCTRVMPLYSIPGLIDHH